MAKLTLTDLAGGYLAIAPYNANGALIEAAMENTLSRDGTTPNGMGANLDMNSNRVTNVTDGTGNQDAVTVAQLNAASITTLTTLDGVGNVDTTGVATGDLLYKSATDWIDTAGLLTWDATKLVVTGAYALEERASAPADVAGQGQIWVKTATPNQLWFTDDAGTDVQLGTGVSDPLLLGDGSESAPTYSFTNEADMGFYRVSATDIGVTIDGTLTFRFTDLNNGMFGGERGAVRGGTLRADTPTITTPTLLPAGDDLNTGVGGADDQISLIAGGKTAVDYHETSTEIIQENHMNVGLTASVTQTQGNGPLISSYNEVSTVANANDTVTLPEASVGRRCIVMNNGANVLQIFPANGDNLGAGTNVSETIAVGETKVYMSYDSIVWMQLGGGTLGGAPLAGRNGAKVFDASAQTIANTTETTVVFDSEAYDTNGFHEGVTNPSRITIPSGVTWVKLKTQIMWDNNSSAERRIKIRKGGSDGAVDDAMTTYQPSFERTSNVGAVDYHHQAETGIINVAATDYFEVRVYQASGGNLDIIASQSWFQIEVIE